MLGNKPVAVKKLLETIDMDEEKFTKEIQCLMKLGHKNVVRFLGYCAETHGEMVNYDDGKPVMADQRNRLLCFEYVPECLKDHITGRITRHTKLIMYFLPVKLFLNFYNCRKTYCVVLFGIRSILCGTIWH